MKIKHIFQIIIIGLIIISCKQEPNKNIKINEIEPIIKKIPNNIDNDFNVFLKYFSKDSVFQVSRVIFPLKVMEVDENNMLESIEQIIEKRDYTTIDFEYPNDMMSRETERYTQKIILKNSKVIIEIRGVDNGICTDFYFVKIKEKWFLEGWNDTSN